MSGTGCSNWRAVSVRRPCPICGKGDWCRVSNDGNAALCGRQPEHISGWSTIGRANDGRTIYARDRHVTGGRRPMGCTQRRRATTRSRDLSTTSFGQAAAAAEGQLRSDALDRAVASLGVRPDSLKALGVGWASPYELRDLKAGGGRGWSRDDGAYVFPERDASGAVVGLSLRTPGGVKGAPKGGSRALCIPDNLDARPGLVLVVEGASDAAACLSLELVAVGRPSNLGGVEDLIDLLRERDVIVVGERDGDSTRRPGLEGAVRVAQDLADAWGRPIRRAMPPPGAKDLRDWVQQKGLSPNAGDGWREAGEELLQSLMRGAALVEPADQLGDDAPRAYPLDALPAPLRHLALQGAVAIGCDPAMIAVPSLVACAGAIGLSARVAIKPGWDEPSILWAAAVAPSGARKDPALDLAAAPLRELDGEGRRVFAEQEAAFRFELVRHEAAVKKWAKGGGSGEPPSEPSCPKKQRLVIEDATFEAVTRMLADTKGASLVAFRGELSAWVKEWGEYSTGKSSSHSAKWLGLHGGRFSPVDRVGAGEVYIPATAVSVTGMIQPEILRRLLARTEHMASGLFARVLWVMPPSKPSFFTDEIIDAEVLRRYRSVVRRLRQLLLEAVRDDEEVETVTLPLSQEAAFLFRDWYDELVVVGGAVSPTERSSASKLEGGAARIALVIALVKAADSARQGPPAEIDGASMAAGIAIARWHLVESQRVLRMIQGGDELNAADSRDHERDAVLGFVSRRGEVGARDLAKNFSRFRGKGGSKAARAVLDSLCGEKGPLERVPGPRTCTYRPWRGRTDADYGSKATEGCSALACAAAGGAEEVDGNASGPPPFAEQPGLDDPRGAEIWGAEDITQHPDWFWSTRP